MIKPEDECLKAFLICLIKLITLFILFLFSNEQSIFFGYLLDGKYWDKFFIYITCFKP